MGNRILFLFACWILLSYCARPLPNFMYKGTLKATSEVSFVNQSEKAMTYEWDFGDGQTSTDSMPTHRYFSSGQFTVKLKASDEKRSRVTEQIIQIAPPDKCLVEMETNHGKMLIQLYDATPQHQDNFVKLVESEYYDSLLFHRVIRGFMIQGGDPNSRNATANTRLGSGGPGYRVPAEFVDTLFHKKGALAAARNNNPEKMSSGSQFYIVQGKKVSEPELAQIESQKGIRYTKEQKETYKTVGGTPFLDQEYTVFGQVLEGMEVIDKIAGVRTVPKDRPKEKVWMKIRVIK